jgi:antiviral helicase SLH1
MLICAPTGAGKTDVALLTMLNLIGQYSTPSPIESPSATNYSIAKSDFKIVYVAPMKALAAEVVVKMGKRLQWLGISVRELTGDMQLTKDEIQRTQVIVTTPEKWDVVTRKSTGDTELAQKVRLLIVDEVHILHEERGAVIESIIARTLRQVETSQTLIRIVGLSATLPNFIDVSDFLRSSSDAMQLTTGSIVWLDYSTLAKHSVQSLWKNTSSASEEKPAPQPQTQTSIAQPTTK